ncbi:MAG: BspA family leucine-rich repeat surface protein [Lactobacillus sp.]
MKKYNFITDKHQRFSFRKYLGIGLCSAVIGSFFITNGPSQQVKADTVDDTQKSTLISSSSESTNGDTNVLTQEIEKNGPPASSLQESTEDNTQDATSSDATQINNNETSDTEQTTPVESTQGTTETTQETETVQGSAETSEAKTAQEPAETPKVAESSEQPKETAPTAKEKTSTLEIKDTKNNVDTKQLTESKIKATTTDNDNGGYDENIWGKLDVSQWTGEEHDNYYELINYTGDLAHIIIPNEADFAKAGKTVGQVAISKDLTRSWFTNDKTIIKPNSIAISKTGGKTVKALGSDWKLGFSSGKISPLDQKTPLEKFDGNNLDVSGITNFTNMFSNDGLTDTNGVRDWKFGDGNITTLGMFRNNNISDLSGLKDWDTSQFTDISYMFTGNCLSDLTPLAKWDVGNVKNLSNTFSRQQNTLKTLTGLGNWTTGKVTDLSETFANNYTIDDISALSNWNVSHVELMDGTFLHNKISDLSPLTKWQVGNVEEFTDTFNSNKIVDLSPLSGWDIHSATTISGMFHKNKISDLAPLADWITSKVNMMNNTFSNNNLTTLQGIEKWDTSNVTEMSGMFELQNATNGKEVGELNDIRALKKWDVGNVKKFNSMFSHNQISDLFPLKGWNVGSGINFSRMFSANNIEDVKPISNWNMSHATDISIMLCENPLNTAVLTNWNLDKVTNAGDFIFVLNNTKGSLPDELKKKVVLVVKPEYVKKMSAISPIPVVESKSNELTINNNGETTIDMPTVYGANSDNAAREAIMDIINAKIKAYQDAHPGVNVIPDKDLKSLSLLELANAFFGVNDSYTNYYKFVDDMENGKQVGDNHSFEGKADQTVLLSITIPENYELAKDQTLPTSYTFSADKNDPIIIHLVHQTKDITDNKTITRTITTIKPDGSSSDEVQTVIFTRTNTKDLVTQKVTYGDWDADSKTFPLKDVEQINGYDSYVDAVKSKVIDSKTVTPDDSNITVTVTYKAQDSGIPDTPDIPPVTPPKKPTDDKPIIPPLPEVTNDPVTEEVEKPKNINKTNKDIEETIDQNGPVKGEKEDNTNHPQNSPVKGEQDTVPVKGQPIKTSTQIAKSNELPQTGEKQTIATAILGLALAGLGLLGISINKKHEE